MKFDGKALNKIIILLYLLGCVITSICILVSGHGRIELSLLSPLFLLIPIILERLFKLERNYFINNILYVFIFCSYSIGTSASIYSSLPGYDKICHFFSGILFTLIGAYIYELLTAAKEKYKIRALNVRELSVYACFSAFFSASCGYIWEIYEYLYSLTTGDDVQKVKSSGIADTMLDMIAALIGTLFVIGYFIYKNKKKINSRTTRRL